MATVSQIALTPATSVVAILSVTTTAGAQVLLQRHNEISDFPVQGMDVLQITAPYIAGITAIALAFMEWVQPSVLFKPETWESGKGTVVNLLLTCIIAVATNFYSYALLIHSSAVTFQVVGNLKTVMVLAVSYISGEILLAARQVIGILASLGAGVFYSYLKLQSSGRPSQNNRQYNQPFDGLKRVDVLSTLHGTVSHQKGSVTAFLTLCLFHT